MTCAAEKSGPPSCARLRKATSFIEWQAEQLRSLKIGPKPSCWVSVRLKFALASAKAVAFVPPSASPRAAPCSVAVSSVALPQPIAPASIIAARAMLLFVFIRTSLGSFRDPGSGA